MIYFATNYEIYILFSDPEHPKPKFIREVLLKCLRLSYLQRVSDSIPESFHAFSPDKPEAHFKFQANPETENNVACMISAKVVAAIKQKSTPEEIMAVLNEIPDDDADQANALKVCENI